MVHDSIRNLRLDRRLLRRRGWISDDELEQELAALPEVGDKAEIVSAEEAEAEAPSGEVPQRD